MIPKILHRCAFGTVPEKFDRFWAEWGELHPDWELMSWSGPLVADEWELGHQFERVHAFSELADLVSAEVVWKFGGVYVDWDTEPLKALDPIVEAHGCWFGSEGAHWFSHGVYGATVEHPAMRAVVDAMARVDFDRDPNETTGPHLLTQVLGGRPDVMLLPKDLFYPVDVNDQAEQEGKSREEIAARFPEAYTTHHWAHSWKDHKSGRMSAYNLEKLADVVV